MIMKQPSDEMLHILDVNKELFMKKDNKTTEEQITMDDLISAFLELAEIVGGKQ